MSDREVSDIRFLFCTGTSKEVLTRIERMLAERNERVVHTMDNPITRWAFAEAWEQADTDGKVGARVRAGLAAVRDLLVPK